MFFYADNQLASVQRGANKFDIFRGAQTPLAEREAKLPAILLAADRANSALQLSNGTSDHCNAYSPYGHLLHVTAHNLLAYNGEYRDLHGFYFLGNGNRAYSPILMRFISPDRTEANVTTDTQNMQPLSVSGAVPDTKLQKSRSKLHTLTEDRAAYKKEAERIHEKALSLSFELEDISTGATPRQEKAISSVINKLLDSSQRTEDFLELRAANQSIKIQVLQARIRE